MSQQFDYRTVRYNDGTSQLAGEILSLEPETGIIAHTTKNVSFFISSPLVIKGDYNFCTYLLTYLLTPWSRVLLEKLTSFQVVKKFPTFSGTRRFITAVKSARHLSLS
jgi:hypothetical protein